MDVRIIGNGIASISIVDDPRAEGFEGFYLVRINYHAAHGWWAKKTYLKIKQTRQGIDYENPEHSWIHEDIYESYDGVTEVASYEVNFEDGVEIWSFEILDALCVFEAYPLQKIIVKTSSTPTHGGRTSPTKKELYWRDGLPFPWCSISATPHAGFCFTEWSGCECAHPTRAATHAINLRPGVHEVLAAFLPKGGGVTPPPSSPDNPVDEDDYDKYAYIIIYCNVTPDGTHATASPAAMRFADLPGSPFSHNISVSGASGSYRFVCWNTPGGGLEMSTSFPYSTSFPQHAGETLVLSFTANYIRKKNPNNNKNKFAIVTTASPDEESGTTYPQFEEVDEGDPCYIEAIANKGWKFKQWNVAGSIIEMRYHTITDIHDDYVCIATFEECDNKILHDNGSGKIISSGNLIVHDG